MASAVPPEEIPTGHTSSDQWQSFEMRMRQRRIDRLVVRADAALAAGGVEDARAAVEELERLSPHAAELDTIRPRLAQALERPTARPVADTMPPVAIPRPIEAPVVKPTEPPEPVVVAPAAPEPPVRPSPVHAPVAKPVIVKPPVVRPAIVKRPVVSAPVVKPPPVTRPPSRNVEPTPPTAVTAPLIVPPPAPRVFTPLETADAPAGSAQLRVEAAPREDSPSAPSESAQRARGRWAQVAAAILIGASVGWLAVTRAPWMARGAPASASAPAAPAPAPPVAPPASEPVSASPEPPAVDIAVTDITPAEPPALVTEPERGTREPAAAALVGQRIPATQPTTAAAVSPTAPAATTPEPVEQPAELPSSTPVPAVTLASSPALERAPEPLPEPPPPAAAAPPAASVAPPPAESVAAAPAAPAAPAAVLDEARIRMTLGRYEAAYSNLDVNAAGAVWPGLDRRALARAFDGLTSQRVDLGNCDVRVAGETAVAECAGTAAWTPKVGGGTHRRSRRWQFRLRSEAGGWQIVSANVR